MGFISKQASFYRFARRIFFLHTLPRHLFSKNRTNKKCIENEYGCTGLPPNRLFKTRKMQIVCVICGFIELSILFVFYIRWCCCVHSKNICIIQSRKFELIHIYSAFDFPIAIFITLWLTQWAIYNCDSNFKFKLK